MRRRAERIRNDEACFDTLVVLMAFAQALAACGSGPRDPPVVTFWGCAELLTGPTCRLEPGARATLRIEAGRQDREPDVTVGGQLGPAPTWIGDTWQFTLSQPAAPTLVSLHVPGAAAWSIGLEPAQDRAFIDSILETSPTASEQARLLQAALPSLDEARRAPALSRLARIQRHDDQADRALATLDLAASAYQAQGRWSEALRDRVLRSYILVDERRLSEARLALDEAIAVMADGHIEGFLPSRYFLAYHEGYLSARVGDLRAALRWMEQTRAEAKTMDDVAFQVGADRMLMDMLGLAGRREEAFSIAAAALQLPPAQEDACFRAGLLNDYAWTLLDALLAGDDPAAWSVRIPPEFGSRPGPVLEQAHALAFEACPEATRGELVGTIALNLALEAFLSGRAVASRQHLAAFWEAWPEPDSVNRFEAMDLEARLAMAAGDPRGARTVWSHLSDLAVKANSPEFEWMAVVGQAGALEIQDDLAGAASLYERGRRILEQHSLLVPIDFGRDAFLQDRASAE